jgi:hypothetical protein
MYWSQELCSEDFDGILLRSLDCPKSREMLQEFYSEVCGGHCSPVVIAHIIIRVGYYWPTIFKDDYEMI